MFRQSLRTFATSARRLAEPPSPYTLSVSKAQGVVKGLTGGKVEAILI